MGTKRSMDARPARGRSSKNPLLPSFVRAHPLPKNPSKE
jgi:hypothetical protein